MATAEESGIVVRMHYMLAASTLVATPPLVIYFKDCWADSRTWSARPLNGPSDVVKGNRLKQGKCSREIISLKFLSLKSED